MTTDRDVTRTVRSWLKDDLASPSVGIVDAVLDQIHVMPQRRAIEPAGRLRYMNVPLRVAVAAAAVVVVAVASFNVLPRQDGSGAPPNPPSTPTQVVSPEPSASIPYVITGPRSGPGTTIVEPGRYRLRGPGSNPVGWPSAVTVTIPDQWYATSAVRGAGLTRGDRPDEVSATLDVSSVGTLVTDPCADDNHLDPELDPALGPSVDDLVAGLTSLPGLEFSEPVDINFDGWSGVQVDMDPPDGCGEFPTLWHTPPDAGEYWSANAREGMRSSFLILDVDGLRLVVMYSYDVTALAYVRRELEQMVRSIDIEP